MIEGINYLFEVFFTQGRAAYHGDGQRLVVGGDKSAAYQGLCEIDVIDGPIPQAMPLSLPVALPRAVKTAAVRRRGGAPLPVRRTSVSCCAAAGFARL